MRPNPLQVTGRAAPAVVPGNDSAVTAEQVAQVVAGIPVIGDACETLKKAGRRASIAGNRITVDDDIFAHFIGATESTHGGAEASWVIYSITGVPPVWIVGAEPRSGPDRGYGSAAANRAEQGKPTIAHQ